MSAIRDRLDIKESTYRIEVSAGTGWPDCQTIVIVSDSKCGVQFVSQCGGTSNCLEISP